MDPTENSVNLFEFRMRSEKKTLYAENWRYTLHVKISQLYKYREERRGYMT